MHNVKVAGRGLGVKQVNLSRCAHCLLGHLALVHVPRALVVVREGGEAGHNAQHGACPKLLMREAQAPGPSCPSIWTSAVHGPFSISPGADQGSILSLDLRA